jgi:uncharacterized membrane protein
VISSSFAFPTEEKAEEVRNKLLEMQREHLIELDDAVIAVKQPNGRVKLNHSIRRQRGPQVVLWAL